MVSALDSRSDGSGSSPGRGTGLCSWARYFTLIVPLFTKVYKWAPPNLLLGVTLQWTSIPSILLVASCYGNWDKLRPDGPLGGTAEKPLIGCLFRGNYCYPLTCAERLIKAEKFMKFVLL